MERSQRTLAVIGGLGAVVVCGACSAASAQTFEGVSKRFMTSVARITAVFPNRQAEHGYGFVVREAGDSLYVATADHVIRPDDADPASDSIVLHFRDEPIGIEASVHSQDVDRDLALLVLPKPHGFSWTYRRTLAQVVPGDRVWIVGRDFQWRPTARDLQGTVTAAGAEVVADFTGAEPGTSGGPLLSRHGIVGMVVNDEGNEVTALGIDVVRNVVYRSWLAVPGIDSIRDFPFVVLTVGGGFQTTMSRTDAKQARFVPPTAWNAALSVAFAPNLGFGLGMSHGGIAALDVTTSGRRVQFRNPSTGYSGSVRFYPASTLRGSGYGLLGVTYMRIDPQLRVDNGAWTSLRDADSVTFDYRDNAWAFSLGAGGWSMTEGNVVGSFEVTLSYTTSPYLSINVLDPYKPQTARDWLVTITFNVGYIFRPARANLRILR